MNRTQILVVDDSLVVRNILAKLLSGEPSFEVVGTASNGQIALDQIRLQQPDLVILDVEMPVMGGLETLKNITSPNGFCGHP
jgi:two-component system chemotaxis response regulator CheB